MATFQPLPRWQDFLPNFRKKKDDLENLLNNWIIEDGGAFWFSRSSQVIATIGRFWQKNNGRQNLTIWFPEYFCNQSTLPIRNVGARLVFYPIKEDLSPNWSKCMELAEDKPPDLFVIVHYFGAVNDGLMAKTFCQKFEALVIEDAAHVVRPYKDIGKYGDFVFYSPHKVFAVPAGAVLVVALPLRKKFLESMEGVPGLENNSWHIEWLIKRALQKALPSSFQRRFNRSIPDFKFDSVPTKFDFNSNLSESARNWLISQISLMDNVCRNRKNNSIRLRERISFEAPNQNIFFSEVNEGPAPYRFVLQCTDLKEAECLYDRIRVLGIPVESWPDLPQEVIDNSQDFSVARKLRDSLIFLPVHEPLPCDDIILSCSGG